jgi:segregation and condensation protein A
MLDNSIQVKIDRFDGPLSLLLHLIQKEELNIRELDLNQITKQYLDYLALMKELNFDVAGEYLYMASSLLYIKSLDCLSEEEAKQKALVNEDDLIFTSKSQLIEKLEELERFKKLGEKLWALDKKGHEVFTRPKIDKKTIVNSILAPMEMQSIIDTMIDLIRRQKRKYTVVRRDRISIKEKLVQLKNTLKTGTQSQFTSLIDEDKGIDDIVITFISLLELARLKKINIFQNESKGEIYLDVVESLEDFDVEVADGFENPEDLMADSLDETIKNNMVEADSEAFDSLTTDTLQ